MAYRAKGLRNLGLTQMIIGSLMFVFGIISIAVVRDWSSYSACGLWVGIWVGLTGLFGFTGARSDTNPNKCLIGLMIGFAVTACVMAFTMLIIYSIALVMFSQRLRCPKDVYPTPDSRYNYYDDCSQYNQYTRHSYPSYSHAQSGAALGSLLLILAVVELFVAFASSIYGCMSCCCTSTPGVQVHQQVTYLQQPGGNVIVINPHGVVPAGSTVQTMSPYPGQPVPVMYGVQPQQGYVASPQAVPQQGYPVQPYQAYPANAQVAGGAVVTQQPRQAFQPPPYKQEDFPPPYNYSGQ